jgi:hypothetical protein
MMKEKKEIPVIHTTVGKPFDIYLQSMSGSTGYDWYLSALPAGLVLIDTRKEPMIRGQVIAPMRAIFTFAADKIGKYTLVFKKLRIWEIDIPVEIMEYQVEVGEVGMERHLGSDKFVDLATHMEHFAGPITPYGFPVADRCVPHGTIHPLYGYPPLHLLYGFPPDIKYGFPANLKYGFPTTKYGFPCEVANVVEDPERCVVMYGTPWGIAESAEHCTVKYGFPIGVKDNLENIFDKSRFPKGVIEDKNNCMLMYGTPHGIAVEKDKCKLKYGFPPIEK